MNNTHMYQLEKRLYTAPTIESIKLDSEISLQLDSAPHGPGEGQNMIVPDYLNNDPFKTKLV
jgi:hypothetical protein